MLTPAEALGLAGMSLSSRVRKAFFKIPEPTLAGLIERIREESARRHVLYLRDGQREVIRVWPCPITILPVFVTPEPESDKVLFFGIRHKSAGNFRIERQ